MARRALGAFLAGVLGLMGLAATAGMGAGAAQAQEFVVTDGRLADRDFYRLVSCAARPGGPCGESVVRWNRPRVRVAFAPIPIGYNAALAQELDRALDNAVAQIRSAAPMLDLRRVPKYQPADIRIFLQPIRAGDLVRQNGYAEMVGVPIGAALVQVYWDGDLNLTEAAIVFAGDIPLAQAQSIMVEELSQAMGLMTDIRNPYYESRSVFSEDSNDVIKLGVQDRMALRRHYADR